MKRETELPNFPKWFGELAKSQFKENGLTPEPTNDHIQWLWNLWTKELNKSFFEGLVTQVKFHIDNIEELIEEYEECMTIIDSAKSDKINRVRSDLEIYNWFLKLLGAKTHKEKEQ